MLPLERLAEDPEASELLFLAGAAGRPLITQIIEVTIIDTNPNDPAARYVASLRAKFGHLAAMSPAERAALQQKWLDLASDIKAHTHLDPADAEAQTLLTRWRDLLQEACGPGLEPESDLTESPFTATSELRDQLWDRRHEWMPAESARSGIDVQAALTRARERMASLADSGVMEFLKRARDARQ
jgi:hypothetical protein